ncbi:MAG TPA: response regulator [Thermoanaerobaculia bacterium]|nr:response regulator [Thermoanaerobaculia bacterium]
MTAISPIARRVLLIDDDDMIAGSLRQYLVTRGCDVDVALEPMAARALMMHASYSVVLLDPYLTGGVHRDGSALIDAVCHLQPRASVIILTGYDSPALARIAADCHVAALLTKPQPVVVLSQLIAAQAAARAEDAANPPITSISSTEEVP